MDRTFAVPLLATAMLFLSVADLFPQRGIRPLGEPDAVFPEAYALVQRVRELPDGRVMLADPLGQVLAIIDLDAGRADTLGRVGQGPDEYRQPDAVFRMPGDSTLLVDLGNARLTVLGPDGSFDETIPMTRGQLGPRGGLTIIMPAGVDSLGRIYIRPLGGSSGRAVPDSAAILRWDRGSEAMDTVARTGLPAVERSESGGPGERSVRMMPVPLSPEDGWAVSWDGRVAVVRAPSYRVEWIGSDGRVVRGEPLSYEPVPIGRDEKEEWAANLGGGLRVGVTVENEDRRVSLGRGGGGRSPDLDALDWPEVKPPFVADGVWVGPRGKAWVRRHVPAGEPALVDIFGHSGRHEATVQLPPDREIVGFGHGVIYLVRTDELGLQWVERYSGPTDL